MSVRCSENFFSSCKLKLHHNNLDIFLIFAQNIDCGVYVEAVPTSTHNLHVCFGAKIRKIGIPLRTPVLLYESGYKGVFITRTCFPDVAFFFPNYPSIFIFFSFTTAKGNVPLI